MTPLHRLAVTLTDAAWLTFLCVTAVPSIVRAGRAKAAEPSHRPADCEVCQWVEDVGVVHQVDWAKWEHEMRAAR